MLHTTHTTRRTPDAAPAYMADAVTADAYRVAAMATCRALRRAADTIPTPHAQALYRSAIAISTHLAAVGLAALTGEQAADTVQAAVVGMLEYAARQGLTLAAVVDGYTDTGAPLTLTTYKGKGDARHVVIVQGPKVAYLIAARAANSYVNAQRTYSDGKISVDALSQGNDYTQPAAYNMPDVHSMDTAQALEFFDTLRTLCGGGKSDTAYRVAVLTMQGYKQAEIAAMLSVSQQLVSRKLARVRALIAASI